MIESEKKEQEKVSSKNTSETQKNEQTIIIKNIKTKKTKQKTKKNIEKIKETTRNNKQETRNNKQETTNNKQETRNNKQQRW